MDGSSGGGRPNPKVVVLPGIGAIDGNDPTSDLMTSIAQFERQIMLARQREGIAKAKAEGKYKGRKPTAKAKADQVRTLAKKGRARRNRPSAGCQRAVGLSNSLRTFRCPWSELIQKSEDGGAEPACRNRGAGAGG